MNYPILDAEYEGVTGRCFLFTSSSLFFLLMKSKVLDTFVLQFFFLKELTLNITAIFHVWQCASSWVMTLLVQALLPISMISGPFFWVWYICLGLTTYQTGLVFNPPGVISRRKEDTMRLRCFKSIQEYCIHQTLGVSFLCLNSQCSVVCKIGKTDLAKGLGWTRNCGWRSSQRKIRCGDNSRIVLNEGALNGSKGVELKQWNEIPGVRMHFFA